MRGLTDKLLLPHDVPRGKYSWSMGLDAKVTPIWPDSGQQTRYASSPSNWVSWRVKMLHLCEFQADEGSAV